MKRIIYLLAAVIGLSLTSSCGKAFFDQVLIEGNWGLIRSEMTTSVNGTVTESLITDCDPLNPKSPMDTQLAIRTVSGNYYEFSTYNWDMVRGAWSLLMKDNLIVRDNVLYIIEGGREMEFGHFTATASTLTIETIDIFDEVVGGVVTQHSTVSRSTYRRLSDLL